MLRVLELRFREHVLEVSVTLIDRRLLRRLEELGGVALLPVLESNHRAPLAVIVAIG